MLKADINNDDAASSKAAALLKAAMQKESVLQDLEKAQGKVDLKTMQ